MHHNWIAAPDPTGTILRFPIMPIDNCVTFGSMAAPGSSTSASKKSPTSTPLTCKIVFLGSYAVGKTSIVNRFMYDQFSRDYEVTMGVDYFTKTLVVDQVAVSLRIWDTAGQEQYCSLIPMYIRDTQVAIIVYDLSEERTFEAAKSWYMKLKEGRQESVRVVLIGNKSDLPATVSVDAVKKFADDHKIKALNVSAKLGTGIDDLFQTVVTEVLCAGPGSEAVVVQQLSSDEEKSTGCWC
jgi:small GTP-binding protein